MHSVQKSTSNYWIKIYKNHESKPLLFQENVSIDYIKGIYCAICYPINNNSHNDGLLIKSNFELNYCTLSDVVMEIRRINENDDDIKQLFGCGCANRDLRAKILNNPKTYNDNLEKFIKKYSSKKWNKIKRFLAFIRINESRYIIQFDSIDFMNGFEMIRMWSSKQPPYNLSLHLLSIYDTSKICKTSVTFQPPQEEINKLLLIFQQINKYLPTVLTQLILQDFAQQCDYHLVYGRAYDTCLTYSVESNCYFHRRGAIHRTLQLENCLARVQLEQL